MKFLSNIQKSLGRFSKKTRKSISPKATLVNSKRKVYYKKVMTKVEKRPLASFIGLLLILLGLIVLSNVINKPKEAVEESALPTKEVQVYSIGESPKITVQAVVEKSGVIKIVSLGSGVVQSVNVEVGQDVSKGTTLVSMSTNYQGGNAFSVQRQLAQAQYKNVLDTYDTQKELIDKQREIAEKQDQNADKLREISNNSLGSTRSLIELNNQMLDAAEAAQALAESNNDQRGIAEAKGLRASLLSANLQLESGLKNAEYAGGDDNAPVAISNISKDIAIKQLDLQRKALDLNKEVSRLSVVLAQITESIMYPSSPVEGKVERIYIKEGQVINPGTPIAQISGNSKSLIAVALLSRETASAVSRSMVSTLHFGNETYEAAPFFVSTDATDGQLYSAQFAIPEEYSASVTNNGYILVEIPIDFPKTGSAIPFIPIDAVFQTQDEAFVFLVKNGKATSQKVKLGTVVGRYVEIRSGLTQGDQVILNRNVISGDPVKTTK